MSSKKPTDEKVSNVAPFGLRMLPELKDRVAAAAAENSRSMNAEIVQRIEDSFVRLEVAGIPFDSQDVALLLDENRMLREKVEDLARALNAPDELLRDRDIAKVLEENQRRMEALLKRFVNPEHNSYQNVGDFAAVDRHGVPAKSFTSAAADEIDETINGSDIVSMAKIDEVSRKKKPRS